MRIIILFLLFLSQHVYAKDAVESYSHNELLKRAKAIVAVYEDVKNGSKNTTIDMLINSSEFKGYTASYLDFVQKGNEAEFIRPCIAVKTTEEIAFHVGQIISKAKPNRNILPSDRFAISVQTYCMMSIKSNE